MLRVFKDSLFKFINYQASGGILLLLATFFAILLANSFLAPNYTAFLHYPLIKLSGHAFSVEHFVNDGLMAIFFLFVSLEIKREVIEGQLSTRDQQILPLVAAIGGVLVPALIYVFFNFNNEVAGVSTVKGWAIPSATDIAFALGVISLLGKRVPIALKAFLTALAIIDDLAAILIIALFYNSDLHLINLVLAAFIVAILLILNKKGVTKLTPYLVLGFILWLLILNSGIHATIAGVLLGLTIPIKDKQGKSPLKKMEHSIEPYCAFLILPIFAFCNAGISLAGMQLLDLFNNPISIGISAGLFFGKQLGVFAFVFVLIKSNIVKMPEGAKWISLYGVSVLTGIGFTMSIFIGNLAFSPELGISNNIKSGILLGSFLSAIIGYFILRCSCPKND